jgi:hypothetical protein
MALAEQYFSAWIKQAWGVRSQFKLIPNFDESLAKPRRVKIVSLGSVDQILPALATSRRSQSEYISLLPWKSHRIRNMSACHFCHFNSLQVFYSGRRNKESFPYTEALATCEVYFTSSQKFLLHPDSLKPCSFDDFLNCSATRAIIFGQGLSELFELLFRKIWARLYQATLKDFQHVECFLVVRIDRKPG